MKPALELSGLRQGRLTVIARVFPNVNGYTRWFCACDCGTDRVIVGASIMRGTQSCGCLGIEARRNAVYKHGSHSLNAYESWAHMIQRCTNPKNKDFSRYGGRGITICEPWMDFANFFADMGERPEGLTLDRIENNDGYYKDNCRWADRLTQGRNRQCVKGKYEHTAI